MCDPHQPRALGERLIARLVLNGMPDLMGGNRDRREGFPIEFIGRQADRFGLRIVMVTLLGFIHLDMRHVEPIEQVACQLPSRSRIVSTRFAMLGKYPPGPELRAEYDDDDNDQQQD